MVLTHIDARPGEVLVRLPNGETRWVAVADLIRLAGSDKQVPAVEEEAKTAKRGKKKP